MGAAICIALAADEALPKSRVSLGAKICIALPEDEALGVEETVGSSISIALDEGALSKLRAAVVGNAADASASASASCRSRFFSDCVWASLKPRPFVSWYVRTYLAFGLKQNLRRFGAQKHGGKSTPTFATECENYRDFQ